MSLYSIVIDTNVLFSALRSQLGASNQLLQLVGTGLFDIHLSVPVFLEYEALLRRQLPHLFVTQENIEELLNYLGGIANIHEVFFLWRPTLRDPDDEMLLELAVTGRSNFIVTYNVRDFEESSLFGIQAITPTRLCPS